MISLIISILTVVFVTFGGGAVFIPMFEDIQLAIEELIRIEKSWKDQAKRTELLSQFAKCLRWMNYQIENNLTNYSLREFLNFAVPLEQELDKNLKDYELVIQKEDGKNKEHRKIPLYLILDNLRSSFNVGSIFRTAECFKISKLFLCGYTPIPSNAKVQKTAMGTIEYLKWEQCKSTINLIEDLKKKNYKIYALETTENGKLLNETNFEKPAVIIMGNEALGIDEKILNMADEIIKIPLFGWKNSLNVAVATAICCYEISNQWKA